jgi:hypothetical protein
MDAATLILLSSLILTVIGGLFATYRYFANKTDTAIKDAAAGGVAKGIQDSALRDNTAALKDLKGSLERYMERNDQHLNKVDAALAVHANRLDWLEQFRSGPGGNASGRSPNNWTAPPGQNEGKI